MGSLRIDNHTPVVVVYRGGIGALAIARTLGRIGVPVYLVTESGTAPISYSRYWKKKYIWDFSAPKDDTLQFLLEVGNEIGGSPILLTLADWMALFIEEYATQLSERFIFPNPPAPLIRRLANKWDMFALARAHGIPTPLTIYPKSKQEVTNFAASAKFPLILKGADPFLPNVASKKVVRSTEELLAEFDRLSALGPPNAVVQEYIPGDSQTVWMCNAYFDSQSECKAIFTGKKLRQVNDTGIASLAVCEPNEIVERQTRSFMQAVGYRGAVGIGWRYDARDGSYNLLDVNARVSGIFRLFRATSGMDIVRILYLDLTGQPLPRTELTNGRKWLLEQDFEAALNEARAGKLTYNQWWNSLAGVQETHWFASDDPLPFAIWLRDKMQPRVRAWREARDSAGKAARPPANHA